MTRRMIRRAIEYAYLFVRFEFVFNFVLPNLVAAKLAVVNVSGACERGGTNALPVLFVEPLPWEPGDPLTFT